MVKNALLLGEQEDLNDEPQNTSREYKCADRVYDFISVLISTSDFVTDVLVVLDFYENGRSAFFWSGIGVFSNVMSCSLFLEQILFFVLC